MTSRRPWYILGAGALGTLFAAQFLASGRPCQLLGRRGCAASSRHIDLDGARLLHVQPVDALAPASVGQLLITTKAYAVADALRDLLPTLHPDAQVVVCANGLGFEEALREIIPGRKLLRAVSTEAAHRSGARVVYAGQGETRVGAENALEAPPWYQSNLDTVPHWRWDPHIDQTLLRKFALNCVINPLTAVHACRNGELLTRAELRRELTELCAETEAALRQLELWSTAASLFDAAAAVCRSTAANRSSMLQDLQAGRRTEIDYLNAYLLRRARGIGLDLPGSARLVQEILAITSAAKPEPSPGNSDEGAEST